MIKCTTGDILKSNAQALVNTVNCEGYMGKGLAYQFKIAYPDMNEDYVKVCKRHELEPGKLHCYRSGDKIIINFPTKNRWREGSRIEYIELGLDRLVEVISEMGIRSIAIPPLGSGNGGLNWPDVKLLIQQKLRETGKQVDVYLYEPSIGYTAHPKSEPRLSPSALILMRLKFGLDHMSTISLQKAAYFMNVFSGSNYFHFTRGQYGPYDDSIRIISQNISIFQKFHHTTDTRVAYDILMNKLISKSVVAKLDELTPAIDRATELVNKLATNHDIECAGTTLFLIEESGTLNEDGIILGFKTWSKDKAERFTDADINMSIDTLCRYGAIEPTLDGYRVARN